MAEDKDTRRRRRRPRRRSGGRSGRTSRSDEEARGGPGADPAPGADSAPRGGGRPRARGGRGQRARQGARGRGRAKTRPGRATGRARPRRDRSITSWWARRWIQVLEGFEVGRRLGRGRNYARQGQVIELELEKGSVTAMVQGSRDAPYLVRMRFSMLSSTDWKKVMRAIGEDPALGGPLLAGEMPENIEDTFREQELSLFPTASGDLKAACSCPDQANPCKHVAAVYYLLAQEFDRDPFLIFRLRGMDRAEIAAVLADTPAARAAAVPPPPRPTAPSEPPAALRSEEPDRPETAEAAEALVEAGPPEGPPEPAAPEPLPTDAHDFWAGGNETPGEPGEVRIPTIHAALSKRLGGFSFWRGEAGCDALMERIYQNASLAGLEVFLCESEAGERS